MSLLFSPAELLHTLRTIYQHLLLLQPGTPYRSARLARLADQTEYCLTQWPQPAWPQYSRQGELVPPYAQVHHWVQQAAHLLTSLPEGLCEQTLEAWQQAAYLLRRTLRFLI